MHRNHATITVYTLAFFLAVWMLVGCSGSSSGSDPSSRNDSTIGGESTLSVTSISPSNGELGVPRDTQVSITFNEAVDPVTITDQTIVLSTNNVAVHGTLTVTESGNIVLLTPSFPLSSHATYTLTVSTNVRNSAGGRLSAEAVSTFTTVESAALGRWTKIAAGVDNAGAVNENGSFWLWGCNYSGQLGNNTGAKGLHNEDSHVPIQIGEDADCIALGLHNSFVVKTNGIICGWGAAYVGDGTSITRKSPMVVGNASDWESVSTGYYFCLAIKRDGTLWAWGHNSRGQLGDGNAGGGTTDTASIADVAAPEQITADADWKSISAGMEHSVAVKTDGTLWTWGSNSRGQLGNGAGGSGSTTADDLHVPSRMGSDSDWDTAFAGGNFTIARKTNGTLWAWGDNMRGQLGDGTTAMKNRPVQVGNDADWAAVAAGCYHAVAIKADGTLWSWGRNDYGQLGNGTLVDETVSPLRVFSVPARVGTDSDWGMIAAGKHFTIATKRDNSLWGWGENKFGQVGDGTSENNRLVPVRIW